MARKPGRAWSTKRDVWTESWRMRNIYFCSEGKLFQREGGACSKPWNCDGDLLSQGNHEHPIGMHLSRTSQTSVPHVATGLHRQWPHGPETSQSPEQVFTPSPAMQRVKKLKQHDLDIEGWWGMDKEVGLGTDCEGLCGPYEEEFGFLCSKVPDASVRGHCGDRRHGSSSWLSVGISFAILAILQCAFSPITTWMLLALHADLFHTSLAEILPCWNYTVETCSCEVCFELAKGDSLRRNDLKALIVKHQLF